MIFILGCPDPEMNRIEEILKEHGCSVQYAMKDGKRCHPGNAYQADNIYVFFGLQEDPIDIVGMSIVLVECQPAGVADFVRVDHHRPGDPGYGQPASQYWLASSLGQIYTLLGIHEIPHEDKILAAMDHSPAGAIRGECPGVSAQEVLDRKVAEVARGTKSSPEEVMERIGHYRAMLESAPKIEMAGQVLKDLRSEYLGEGYSLSLLAAQAAALAGGHTALLRHRDAMGKPEKWSVSGHATPETVNAFMMWGPKNGLVKESMYGVPERGYAGGYLSR